MQDLVVHILYEINDMLYCNLPYDTDPIIFLIFLFRTFDAFLKIRQSEKQTLVCFKIHEKSIIITC